MIGAKLSEGINFADDMARGESRPEISFRTHRFAPARAPLLKPFVSSCSCRCLRYERSLCTSLAALSELTIPPAGIPYPNSQSAELKERMAYLREESPNANSRSSDAGQILCMALLAVATFLLTCLQTSPALLEQIKTSLSAL